MFLFVCCIIILYLLSVGQKKYPTSFQKEKSFPLKGILAVLIVLHHITFEIDTFLLRSFHSWGAPVVSIFFFISGYGLMTSYQVKGKNYLSGFIKHRLIDSILIPYLLALLLFRLIATGLPNIADAVWLLITRGFTTLPHSWYVFAILILYTFFYLTCRLMKGRYILLLVTLLSSVYAWGVWRLGYDRCWYISVLAFPTGIAYAQYSSYLRTLLYKNKMTRWIVPICLLLAAALYILHYEVGYMLIYMLIPLMVVYLCSALNVERLGKIKAIFFLSSISYEIYLCQGIAILLSDKAGLVQYPVVYVLMVFCMTFFFAYIVKQAKSFIVTRCI